MRKVLRNTDAKSLQVPCGMMWRHYERSRQNRDERRCACPSTFPQLGAVALEEYARTRLCALPSRSGLSPANLPHSYRALFSQGILSTTALRALPRPVDIIVEKDSDRLNGKQIRNHVWMRQIPERSFVTIEPSVRLSTPEFTYLQMATALSLPRLASYACEIAGGYSLNQGGRSSPRARH